MKKIKFLYVFLFYFGHSLLMEEEDYKKSIRDTMLCYRHKKKTIGIAMLFATAGTLFWFSNKEKDNLFNLFSPQKIREINKKDISVSLLVGATTGLIGYLFFKPCLHRHRTHEKVKSLFVRIKDHHEGSRGNCYLNYYSKDNAVEEFLKELALLTKAWSEKQEFSQKEYTFIASAKDKIKVIEEEIKEKETFKKCNTDLIKEAIEYVGKNYKKECILEGHY